MENWRKSSERDSALGHLGAIGEKQDITKKAQNVVIVGF